MTNAITNSPSAAKTPAQGYTLAVVILNYRTPQLVIDCLASLEPEIAPHAQSLTVVVVDNDSGDGSVDHIQAAIDQHQWQAWATLVPSPVNGGFSAGNNVGIRAVEAETYLLLNSDTIVRPGAIASLLEALDTYPDAGLISPRLEWPDGTPQISCFRYHSPLSELIDAAATGPVTKLLGAFDVPIAVQNDTFEPQWTSFACVAVRQTVLDQIGLMDEDYFMYYDDVDVCRRAWQGGFRVRHWPQARVVHLRGGSGSTKTDVAARKRPRQFLYASRSRYFRKFYGPAGLLLANLGWGIGRAISLLRETVGGKAPHTCEYQAIDIWTNWSAPLQAPTLPARSKS